MKTLRVSLLLGVSVLLLLSGLTVSEGVEVYEGEESVLLPFQVPVSDSRGSTVVWNRIGLTLGSVVHLLKPEGEDFSDQNPQYSGRTSMRTDALQTGELTLTLRKPTIRDSGTYTCIVRRGGEDLSRTAVQLLVRGQRHVRGVEVYEGEESVLLPCQVPESDSRGSTVLWNRICLSLGSFVHILNPKGEDFSDQNPQYSSRTSMRTDALETGDLTLTLRKPTIRDSGTYICNVRRRGQELRETTVQLLVKELPSVSVVRLVIHLVVFCPFFISTGLMVSICCSMKTGK